MTDREVNLVKLHDPLFEEHFIELYVYQLQNLHPTVNGNKWFKLKYNLEEAKRLKHTTIVTFGGAWSNHIYATAASCKELGYKSIGVIRGERPGQLNSCLQFAESCGMHLHFIDRENYRKKESVDFQENLRKQFGEFYLIPEGGANALGVKGCREIMDKVGTFDYVCCACGTGATIAGLTLSLTEKQQAIGFSALKGGGFLVEEIEKFRGLYLQHVGTTSPLPSLTEKEKNRKEVEIIVDYHFGGYAKVNSLLTDFVKAFEKQHHIALDYVYTAKMMFGLYDLIRKNHFKPGSKIIALHTGGMQGNKGFEN